MRIIVTGGAGFIGSTLVKRLVADGNKVTVLDNFTTGNMDNLSPVLDNVSVIDAVSSSIGRLGPCDVIFHLGIPSSSPMYVEDPALIGKSVSDMVQVLEFAARREAKLVFASSSSLYNGNPLPNNESMPVHVTDYYTETRFYIERLSELYDELYNFDSVGLRFFSVYGPNERAKGRYANIVSQFLWSMQGGNSPVIYGDGKQTRDFTFVDDVVSACALAMQEGVSGIFNVGTGKRNSFNDVVGFINAELGTSIDPTYIDNPIKNYVDHTLADNRQAVGVLGFDAKISLEQGIHKLCESL